MLAHTSKYGLKALHYIAIYSSEENRILAKDVAKALDLQKPFLSKILKQLATKNFIQSVKGPYGGFYLTEKQKDRSVMDVIIELEGRDRFTQCVLNFENCNEKNPCPIHNLVAFEKESLRNSIKNVRIADLHEDLNYL
jgi:Rrf2 family protein